MKHLKELLIRLQTFELKINERRVKQDSYDHPPTGTQVYDISHETKYYDSYTFETGLRILSELATVDLVGLKISKLQVVLDQLDQIKERFRAFWKNYHNHYFRNDRPYTPGYLIQIGFHELFLIRNLQPEGSTILIDEKFADDLADSVRLRETILAGFIRQAQKLVLVEEDRHQKQITAPCRPTKKITNQPVFVDGIADKYFEIIKSYFSSQDQPHLQSLLHANLKPPFPLLFHGNGNQLVDGFKQLYEGNLIVSCQKIELEEWIGANFKYVYQKEQKTFPANYLNAIISSNSKPCQSPILDVKKQPDGTYTIIPVVRTKKNYIPR